MSEDGSLTSDPPLVARYNEIRRSTESLCSPLETEDFTIAPTPEIGSPIKWHLAHTSWFFETFILTKEYPGYQVFHPRFSYLFNSYYISVGERHTRSLRGSVSRPSVDEVFEYRKYVDAHMERFLEESDEGVLAKVNEVIEIGLQHEQQHQELILSDIKHIFWNNPTYPTYKANEHQELETSKTPLNWIGFEEAIRCVGFDGDEFAFDNERPRHQQFVPSFEIGSRLITNGEYLEFIEDQGYENGRLWLDLGWDLIQAENWAAPFYWEIRDGAWHEMTLSGFRELDLNQPVSHISYFEADAYARWAGERLATEAEWETAAQNLKLEGNFQDDGVFHPQALTSNVSQDSISQMYGDLWEWTQSHYSPYRGYQAPPGALGEYNGKFMCNMFVLKGGACVTPKSHVRLTYRNFFGPEKRWPFTGIRLARDA